MYYMAIVSVRVEDEVLSVLKAHQVNVSEVARKALGEQARRLRALDELERLGRLRLPVEGPGTADVIREGREDRHARD
jgi:hypothetical protein